MNNPTNLDWLALGVVAFVAIILLVAMPTQGDE